MAIRGPKDDYQAMARKGDELEAVVDEQEPVRGKMDRRRFLQRNPDDGDLPAESPACLTPPEDH